MAVPDDHKYLSFIVEGDPYWRQELMYDGGYGKAYGNFYYLGSHWKQIWKYDNLEGDTIDERPTTVTVRTRLLAETLFYYEDKCVQYNTSTGGHEPVTCWNEFEIETQEFKGITGTKEEDGLRGTGTAVISDDSRGERRPIEPRISNRSLDGTLKYHIGLNLQKCARTDTYDLEK
ncbi:hypothetical protein P170DRAFT_465815 [Aspergillus steynii IBT 23096]|uniref:Uncharacterized protein n=1 Tax=Aspergillus steynii IBT 23096 TaxID=1392250 RepID=A0A2I2G6G6_9EURO|nr:uncharacterized protein P170DRAFT_465815 [Aspergillus steynii IBT 23096]PLB48459.1 hypothetical protein P170DRAFT_465815 [Aspergillus steynii IBT 23096]